MNTALKKLLLTQIRIDGGTQRDAVWKSFAANVKHGLRRQPGVLAEILRKIYDDAEWAKVSQVEIAKHVGCNNATVSKNFKQFEEESASFALANDTKKTENVGKRTTKLEVQRGGQKYEMSVPSKESKTKEDIEDSAGNIVPKGLRDIFGRKDDIQDFLDDLNRIHKCITELMTKGDPLWRCFNYNAFDTEIKNLKDVFTIAMPFSVCGYCGGKVGNMDCRACHGSGWVNKTVYIATPEEFKKTKNEPD